MVIKNLMTASGFADGLSIGGDWFMAWVYVGLLGIFTFLGETILHRNMDVDFNLIGGLLGVLAAILIITFTGWLKVAFIVGLIVLVLGGFFLDSIMGRFGN